jgi:hypothetical protein
MWAGISFPISSFLVLVLEAYGYLSPHSIVTLAAFVHLCEMFVGVRPSVMLLHHFIILRPVGNNDVIDEHYFQTQGRVASHCITKAVFSKWDDWRRKWFAVRADRIPVLELSTEPPI